MEGNMVGNVSVASRSARLCMALIALALADCGGGGSGAAPSYFVSGTIQGLGTSGLVLVSNNMTVAPAAGATSFVFAQDLAPGTSYSVTVRTEPLEAGCSVANGNGQIGTVDVTNIVVTCRTHSFAIGGTVLGLATSGLQLTDGAESIGIAANATSFSFPTPVAYASGYSVAVATQPQGGVGCTVENGSGTMPAAAVTGLMVYCANDWIWEQGASAPDAPAIVGAVGVPSSANTPGRREFGAHWIDAGGHLWLFGGWDSTVTTNYALNDMWSYDPAVGQWKYLGGTNGTTGGSPAGSYGTLGVAATSNVPGGRGMPASFTDASGNFWLFGGYGFAATSSMTGFLNDLWKFAPATGEWTWVAGANSTNALTVYGSLGTAATGNGPGGREPGATWIDGTGRIWVFGGYDASAQRLNDLWMFDPASGLWTWESGASTANSAGVYGQRGVAAPGNVPGARYAANGWVDAQGRLWLFGGWGYDSTGAGALLNDLWMFDTVSKTWTWVAGANVGSAAGVSGSLGVAAPGNTPGARQSAMSWTDSHGTLWLFGGTGNSTPYAPYNDL